MYVLIWGSSIVRDIAQFCRSNHGKLSHNLDLEWSGISIFWRYKPGALLGHAKAQLLGQQGLVQWKRPNVIILQVGSNDLCKAQNEEEAQEIAFNLVELVNDLIKHSSVKCVVISAILPRTVRTWHMMVPLEQFNSHVHFVNELLQGLYTNNPKVKFWTHRELETFEQAQGLLRDGVHPNHLGCTYLARDYRGAILYVQKWMGA